MRERVGERAKKVERPTEITHQLPLTPTLPLPPTVNMFVHSNWLRLLGGQHQSNVHDQAVARNYPDSAWSVARKTTSNYPDSAWSVVGLQRVVREIQQTL